MLLRGTRVPTKNSWQERKYGRRKTHEDGREEEAVGDIAPESEEVQPRKGSKGKKKRLVIRDSLSLSLSDVEKIFLEQVHALAKRDVDTQARR